MGSEGTRVKEWGMGSEGTRVKQWGMGSEGTRVKQWGMGSEVTRVKQWGMGSEGTRVKQCWHHGTVCSGGCCVSVPFYFSFILKGLALHTLSSQQLRQHPCLNTVHIFCSSKCYTLHAFSLWVVLCCAVRNI